MGCHINWVHATQLIQRLPALGDLSADAIRAFMQTHHDIDFPPHPFGIVWIGPR
jgi:hypothetical protein